MSKRSIRHWHTKIHLNEIDAPEWQKIVYSRQAWREMVGKIDIYE